MVHWEHTFFILNLWCYEINKFLKLRQYYQIDIIYIINIKQPNLPIKKIYKFKNNVKYIYILFFEIAL